MVSRLLQQWNSPHNSDTTSRHHCKIYPYGGIHATATRSLNLQLRTARLTTFRTGARGTQSVWSLFGVATFTDHHFPPCLTPPGPVFLQIWFQVNSHYDCTIRCDLGKHTCDNVFRSFFKHFGNKHWARKTNATKIPAQTTPYCLVFFSQQKWISNSTTKNEFPLIFAISAAPRTTRSANCFLRTVRKSY